MDYLAVLREWGWVAVLALFIIKEVWPQTFAWISKASQQKLDAALAAEKEEREERAAERVWRHTNDERQITAFEKLVESNKTQTELMVAINERLSHLEVSQANLTTFMVGAVADMRERVARDARLAKQQQSEGKTK